MFLLTWKIRVCSLKVSSGELHKAHWNLLWNKEWILENNVLYSKRNELTMKFRLQKLLKIIVEYNVKPVLHILECMFTELNNLHAKELFFVSVYFTLKLTIWNRQKTVLNTGPFSQWFHHCSLETAPVMETKFFLFFFKMGFQQTKTTKCVWEYLRLLRITNYTDSPKEHHPAGINFLLFEFSFKLNYGEG